MLKRLALAALALPLTACLPMLVGGAAGGSAGRAAAAEITTAANADKDAGAKMIGIAYDAGLVITDVDPNGPAAAKGVRAGDVIEKVDGNEVTTVQQIAGQLIGPGGRKVGLDVRRGKESLYFRVMRRCLPELGCIPPQRNEVQGSNW